MFPFPFLPVSASQWLPQCSDLTFVPSVFPVLSCLVSRAFFPGVPSYAPPPEFDTILPLGPKTKKAGDLPAFQCLSKQKSPDFSVETASPFLYPLFIKRWFPSCDFHTLCLTNRFVCNFLSSSASFNLCSCFFWLTLVFHFRFRLSLGRPFHDLSSLPVHFLTPAVSASFRPLQFWILTTQPLFFLSFSSRFRLTAAFPGARLHSRFLGFPFLSDLVSRVFRFPF